MGVFKSNKEKVITYIVYAVYLMLLCWLVLFKFAVSVDLIPHIRGINMIPFHYDKASPVHMREVIFNIIVFVPAGVYFMTLFSKKNILLGVAGTAILSLLFEVVQYVFAIGASDITDLITNTIGGLCGMVLFWVICKITDKYKMTIINSIGSVIEIFAIFILFITFL